MTDLSDTLRTSCYWCAGCSTCPELQKRAADEIDKLTADLAASRAECEEMRELLGSLLGAMPPHVLKKWPNITKRAKEAAAGGEVK